MKLIKNKPNIEMSRRYKKKQVPWEFLDKIFLLKKKKKKKKKRNGKNAFIPQIGHP